MFISQKKKIKKKFLYILNRMKEMKILFFIENSFVRSYVLYDGDGMKV